MGEITKTFRLIKSMPSFHKGLGRVIDVGNTIDEYNISKSGEIADREAISADWGAVGDDIKTSIKNYAQQINL